MLCNLLNTEFIYCYIAVLYILLDLTFVEASDHKEREKKFLKLLIIIMIFGLSNNFKLAIASLSLCDWISDIYKTLRSTIEEKTKQADREINLLNLLLILILFGLNKNLTLLMPLAILCTCISQFYKRLKSNIEERANQHVIQIMFLYILIALMILVIYMNLDLVIYLVSLCYKVYHFLNGLKEKSWPFVRKIVWLCILCIILFLHKPNRADQFHTN